MKMNEKILQCRKRMGLSQEELAQCLNTSRQAVSRWELGDAQPELNNVIALAKLFGVTTDWLLMDTEEPDATEPATEPEPNPEPEPAPQEPVYSGRPNRAASPAEDTWLEHIPGFIGRMLKRYGWVYGVYLAIGGLMFTVMGCIAVSVSNSMIDSMAFSGFDMSFSGLGSGNVTLYGESGEIITDPDIYNALGFSAPASRSSSGFPNPVAALGRFIVVIGVVMMIGGTVLAVVLKRKANQS